MAATAKVPASPVTKKQETNPDSIPKVLWMLTKTFVTSIPKQALWILLKSAGIFLFIMWLNFYVIAVKNAGYGGGPIIDGQVKPWVWLFNVGKNRTSFNLLAFMIPLLLTSLWVQVRTLGFKKFFRNLFQVIHWTGYCASNAGRQAIPVLMFAMAAMMPLGIFMQNTGLYATFAVSQFFGYVAQNRNLVFLFSRAGWMDFQRVFRGKKTLSELNPGIGGLLSLGLMLGAVFLILIPPQLLKVFSIILFLLFAGLGIFSKVGKAPPKAVAALLLFVGVNLLWFRLFGRVFADDAGFDELGNNMGNYIRDPGGRMVIREGVQPGMLGVLGGWIGSVLGTVADAGLYMGGKVVDGATYVGGKVVDGATYVGGKVVDGATYVGGKVVDGVKYVGGKVVDGANYVADTAVGAVNETISVIADLNNPEIWDGMWEGIEHQATEAEQDLANAWETTKDLTDKAIDAIATAGADAADAIEAAVRDVWNNPGIYLDTLINGTLDTIREVASLGAEVLQNPQILVDTLTGTIGDLAVIGGKAVSVAGNVVSSVASGIWTTITDPGKAWAFVKDSIGYENFMNAFDPSRGLWSQAGQIIIGTIKLGTTITGAQAIYGAGTRVVATGVTQTIRNFADDAAGLITKGRGTGAIPIKPQFATLGPANTAHMNQAQLTKFQELVRRYGFDEASVRMGGSKEIMERMVRGEVLPKGHDLMNKTVNALDEAFLGGPKDSRGLASHFRPTLPSAEDMGKMDPKTLEKVWDRYLQRYDEFLTQDASIKNLVSKGKITLDPDGLIKDAATGKPFGSDWDLFNILKDGQQVPKAVHDAFINDCIKSGLPIRHGTLVDWANMSDFQKEAYGKMIRAAMKEGVISVGPDGVPMHKILQEFIKSAPQ